MTNCDRIWSMKSTNSAAQAFPKTKPVIQSDAVRVSAKSKDELQAVIADLRALDYPIALQFTNYR